MTLSELRALPTIALTGGVDERLLDTLDRRLEELRSKKVPEALVVITTSGGRSLYAVGLYERLRIAQVGEGAIKLHILALGAAHSAGVIAMLAIPKDRRYVTKNTSVMFHEAWANNNEVFNGPRTGREILLESLNADYEYHRTRDAWITAMMVEDTKKSVDEINQLSARGRYLIGQEAVDFGLVGVLIEEV